MGQWVKVDEIKKVGQNCRMRLGYDNKQGVVFNKISISQFKNGRFLFTVGGPKAAGFFATLKTPNGKAVLKQLLKIETTNTPINAAVDAANDKIPDGMTFGTIENVLLFLDLLALKDKSLDAATVAEIKAFVHANGTVISAANIQAPPGQILFANHSSNSDTGSESDNNPSNIFQRRRQ